MTTTPFRGVYPAITTPFAEDDSIDFERLRENVRRLESAGVDGIVPVGSTGESATLSHEEHVEVIEAVVGAVEDVPVVAGAGSNSTREALWLARHAVDAGADALLLISPYYNRPEQEGLYRHYRRIADAVDVPQVVYNVSSRTGRSIHPDTVVDLAEHPNVQGYKAASGDLGAIGEVIERTADETFSVLSGDDALTLPMLSMGGTGAISVAANVEPERTCELVHAALEGDYDRARRRHQELGDLFRALFVETNPVPVTAALEMRGLGPGRLRDPLTEIGDENREHLAEVLAALDDGPQDAVPAGGEP